MEQFNKIARDAKAAWAALESRFNAIQSPAVKIAVALFAALLVLMLVWAVLPWIGLILVLCVSAIIARAFWPSRTE